MPVGRSDDFKIRKLTDTDSLAELTLFLNRAYASLAEAGLRYTATYQDEAITRKRIADGECYLAELDGALIGSISYYPPGVLTYQYYGAHPEIAAFGQLGVEPSFRKKGVGSGLVSYVEERARSDGAPAIALDTAIPATHLVRWYRKLGYRIVGEADWESTNYRSYIMRKLLL